MNKSRVRLGPHLIAQTQLRPNPLHSKGTKMAGSALLVLLLVVFIYHFSQSSPTIRSSLPVREAVLGAQEIQVSGAEMYEYQAQASDTLFSLSQKFQIPLEQLARINNLREPFSIAVGQKINIPANLVSSQRQFYDNLKKKIYIVSDGDSFVGIAQKLNLSVTDLLRVNPNLSSPDFIKPGQTLKLP